MVQQVVYNTTNGQIIEWQDTSVHAYAVPPAGTALLTLQPWQWSLQGQPYYVLNGMLFPGNAPAPALSVAQQVAQRLVQGLQITCTSTPAINGTYACDSIMQAKIAAMDLLIIKAGGNAFPGGAASILWEVLSGPPITFTSPALLLEVFTAIGAYVFALDQAILTNSQSLPPASATIA